jgi:hypothetical protein
VLIWCEVTMRLDLSTYRSLMSTSVSAGPRPDAPPGGTPKVAPRLPFVVTVFVGSFLLFQVQPLVARLALPELGGAAAVWNSAMLVYQALLLAGYAWAHFLRRFSVARQVALHLGLLLLACLWLPIGLVGLEPPSGEGVVFFVPILLLVSVGPVLLAVSAQAPLMQQWFSAVGSGRNPYALYAASNLGSFTGLLAYPLLVEPMLRIDFQRWGWTVLYLLLIVLVGACGAMAVAAIRRRGPVSGEDPGGTAVRRSQVPASRVLLWLALSAVPSALMLSTTTHLSTDIMAMPLLWAIPLGLYLLSFTVAFAERRGLSRVIVRITPVLLLLYGATALISGGTGSYGTAAASVATLFAVAVAMHSRLYDSRPPADNLTYFYLVTSIGGALGGIFCGLVAPLAFDWVYEHPILIIAAALLVPLHAVSSRFDLGALGASQSRSTRGTLLVLLVAASLWLDLATGRVQLALLLTLIVVGVLTCSWRAAYVLVLIALMCGLGARNTIPPSFTGDRARSYFGVYTVREDPASHLRTLWHGAVVHGVERTSPGDEKDPTGYYAPSSGAGLVLAEATSLFGTSASVGVVGLGAGTLACYREDGQTWQFFEIDPLVVEIARDTGQFHFLSACAPDAKISVGDARIELGSVREDNFDVLAVDAFSSDSIPMHLMTREAFEVYDRVVSEDGVVLVHISNKFIDLEPVLSALVRDEGWHAVVRDDTSAASDAEDYTYASVWVALSRDERVLDRIIGTTGAEWRLLSSQGAPRPWTDDFASVLPLLR